MVSVLAWSISKDMCVSKIFRTLSCMMPFTSSTLACTSVTLSTLAESLYLAMTLRRMCLHEPESSPALASHTCWSVATSAKPRWTSFNISCIVRSGRRLPWTTATARLNALASARAQITPSMSASWSVSRAVLAFHRGYTIVGRAPSSNRETAASSARRSVGVTPLAARCASTARSLARTTDNNATDGASADTPMAVGCTGMA
mmetsp:Transcript_73100/g.143385  ORF Transcript_73100/g.143385 Transcript_73100/m.143385 type:complete len:203 (-) Transcript_73100:78-686(-)